MKQNTVLRTLREGRLALGANLSIGCVDIVEYAAELGLDWLFLDWQHGSWSEETLFAALATFHNSPTMPIVRVRGHNGWEIGKVLDMGAMGVVVPMVNSPQEAEQLVRWAKFTPRGDRSAGGMRPSILADGLDVQDYFASANEETMVVPMIERVRAVERAEGILRLDGVDCLLVGPGDLLMDVQAHGGDEAKREQYLDEIVSVGERVGKPVGIACGDIETARRNVERGFTLVYLGTDTRIIRAGLGEIAKHAARWRSETDATRTQ
jgi:4-hydroxy-2-oxoheptanedioate aldolase